MIDMKVLEVSLHAIIEPVVIAADSAAILIIEPNSEVVPFTSFATMKTESFNQVGLTEMGDVDTAGDIQVRAQYVIKYKFESFGPNSKNILSSINFSILNNILIHESLVDINLFQFDTPIVTDIPDFVDTAWEERNQTTISFAHAHEEKVQISVIEQATLKGTFKDIADRTVLTTSRTITTT